MPAIHDFPKFDSFIGNCPQEVDFYRYADPLADVIVNMAEEDNGFQWHFDTGNFIVILAVQNAEYGGQLEYAPGIGEVSENFDEAKRGPGEKSDKVCVLNLEPGDFQLFRCRCSKRKVRKMRRYVIIFSYLESGRTLPSLLKEQCNYMQEF